MSFDIIFNYYYEKRTWQYVLNINEKFNQIRLYSYYPNTIPEEKSLAICKKITQINSGLPIGNFEFDLESHKLRFKTYLELETTEVNNAQLQLLFEANIYTLEKFFLEIEKEINT